MNESLVEIKDDSLTRSEGEFLGGRLGSQLFLFGFLNKVEKLD